MTSSLIRFLILVCCLSGSLSIVNAPNLIELCFLASSWPVIPRSNNNKDISHFIEPVYIIAFKSN